MARRKNEVDRLRREALRLQRNAMNKMSRIKNKRRDEWTGEPVGPKLRNTKFDPTKPKSNIQRLNSNQLQTHIERLKEFLHPSTQFVADEEGVPETIQKWRAYKWREQRRNQMLAEQKADRQDLFINPLGLTVQERHEQLREKRTQNPSVNIEDIIEREPFNLAKITQLDKLIKLYDKRLESGYDEKRMEAAKKSFEGMMGSIENDELMTAVNKLTPGQFDVLWNDTTFAWALGTVYEIIQRANKGNPKDTDEKRMADQYEMVRDLIEWAGRLKR